MSDRSMVEIAGGRVMTPAKDDRPPRKPKGRPGPETKRWIRCPSCMGYGDLNGPIPPELWPTCPDCNGTGYRRVGGPYASGGGG